MTPVRAGAGSPEIAPPAADLLFMNLHMGRDRAESIGSLAERMQMPRRAIEAAVEALRRSGAAICSGSEGIWLTDDPDELIDQYRRLRRRAIHQLANLRAMQRTARNLRGYRQTELFWKFFEREGHDAA
jgi:biotin operon repressor